MAIDLPTIPAPPHVLPFTAAPPSDDFAQRWAAWQAKGAAHDRAVRRKSAAAAIGLSIVAAGIIYWTLVIA